MSDIYCIVSSKTVVHAHCDKKDESSDYLSRTATNLSQNTTAKPFRYGREGPTLFLDNNVFLFMHNSLPHCEMKDDTTVSGEKIICIWNCKGSNSDDDFSFTYRQDTDSIIDLFKNLHSFYDVNRCISALNYSLIIVVYKNNQPNRVCFSVDREGTCPLYYKVDGKNHVIEICSSYKYEYEALPEGFMIEIGLTDKLEIEKFKCSSYA